MRANKPAYSAPTQPPTTNENNANLAKPNTGPVANANSKKGKLSMQPASNP